MNSDYTEKLTRYMEAYGASTLNITRMLDIHDFLQPNHLSESEDLPENSVDISKELSLGSV